MVRAGWQPGGGGQPMSDAALGSGAAGAAAAPGAGAASCAAGSAAVAASRRHATARSCLQRRRGCGVARGGAACCASTRSKLSTAQHLTVQNKRHALPLHPARPHFPRREARPCAGAQHPGHPVHGQCWWGAGRWVGTVTCLLSGSVEGSKQNEICSGVLRTMNADGVGCTLAARQGSAGLGAATLPTAHGLHSSQRHRCCMPLAPVQAPTPTAPSSSSPPCPLPGEAWLRGGGGGYGGAVAPGTVLVAAVAAAAGSSSGGQPCAASLLRPLLPPWLSSPAAG